MKNWRRLFASLPKAVPECAPSVAVLHAVATEQWKSVARTRMWCRRLRWAALILSPAIGTSVGYGISLAVAANQTAFVVWSAQIGIAAFVLIFAIARIRLGIVLGTATDAVVSSAIAGFPGSSFSHRMHLIPRKGLNRYDNVGMGEERNSVGVMFGQHNGAEFDLYLGDYRDRSKARGIVAGAAVLISRTAMPEGTTIVAMRPKGPALLRGAGGSGFIRPVLRPALLDDAEFNRRFEVYSNDPRHVIEGFLHPGLRTLLSQLADSLPSNALAVAFVRNMGILAMPFGRMLLRPEAGVDEWREDAEYIAALAAFSMGLLDSLGGAGEARK